MNQSLRAKEFVKQTSETQAPLPSNPASEIEALVQRLLDRVEGLVTRVQSLFQRGREQTESIKKIGQKVQETVAPALVPMLVTGRNLGRRVSASYRRDPRPYLIGGTLLLGGLAMLYYYSTREENEAGVVDEPFGTNPEPWRTDGVIYENLQVSGDSIISR